ncbi:N-acetylneuraminate synthase family protein [Aquabacterium sp. A7-Y]|uniref:N-acetylneuraminate synthase family protein n=1 Tax=Aquabacterium sp. A7-Y TaxID=1349605 RepID=UPI00223D4E7D|nr:N-acetylneuraminate synthase family protein [Aquabacterium sp. A7-Y]MCW7536783.1 N-acetylneuraminate synthase family protein [Aquabacterium sp. A7-Y]
MAISFNVGNKTIGTGHPVFVIAEIGYNFNTLAQARESIDAAVECGVDAIKFQTFRAETITTRSCTFPAEAGGVNQFDEFKRYELDEAAHRELFAYAATKGMLAFSSPSHYDDAALLDRLGVPAFKLGSDDLTNLPFLDHVARLGKPLIFSTGMGSLTEVVEAYETVAATGKRDVAILHCLSNYPVHDLTHLNLRAISLFRTLFDVQVGYSDHTVGVTAALGAVALGATVIEKHFTLDKNMDAPDAFFSADPAEMKALVSGIRELEVAMGEPVKRPAPSELEMRTETRKSVVARRKIAAGERITEDKLIIKRPGHGVPPKAAHLLVGRCAKSDIAPDEVISWDMVN